MMISIDFTANSILARTELKLWFVRDGPEPFCRVFPTPTTTILPTQYSVLTPAWREGDDGRSESAEPAGVSLQFKN